MKPQDIIKRKPFLAWYVKNPGKLTDESVLERVLSYGDWEGVQQYIQIKRLKETSRLFSETAKKQRSNYLPEIEHYFSNYFRVHAF